MSISSISLEEEKEIRRSIGKGRKDFRTKNLVDINLYGKDLRRINFTNCYLEGADLRNCNLEGTNFSQACVRRAKLSGSNLSGANLSNANFNGVDLSHTSLKNARILYAQFLDAYMFNANLSDANLNFTDFTGADLSGCDFSQTSIKDSCFNGTERQGADFSDCNYMVFDVLNGDYVVCHKYNGAIYIGRLTGTFNLENLLNRTSSETVRMLGEYTDDYLKVFKRIKRHMREDRWPSTKSSLDRRSIAEGNAQSSPLCKPYTV